MFGIGVPEFILILVIGLIVFGPGKLPEMARSLGKGMREFKKATNALSQAINEPLDTPVRPQQQAATQQPAAQPQPAAPAMHLHHAAPRGPRRRDHGAGRGAHGKAMRAAHEAHHGSSPDQAKQHGGRKEGWKDGAAAVQAAASLT